MSDEIPAATPMFVLESGPVAAPSAEGAATGPDSSQALYRRYRSRDFHELVGQEPIVQTLRNALAAGRLAHAYLFCGPRGTGKTSTARLLAKAVNCLAPPGVERPCNACLACRAINEGRAMDLIEIDAASNNSVEDVRDLRERVNFAPAQLRRKFYIIDEVHMMSISAFNALLKTLEEPPAHTIFVLATTDPQKLPATVLSRCQRFDFRRISLPVMVGHMQHIVAAEGFTLEPGVLELIGRQAQGCMRDALSLLDQLMSFADGRLTLAQVQGVLGTRSTDEVARFVDALIAGDMAAGLQLLHGALDNGADLRQLNRQFVEHLRALLLLRAGGDQAALDATGEEVALLRAQARRVGLPALTAWIRAFSNADNGLKNTLYGALPLELALVEANLATTGAEAAPAGRAGAPGPGDGMARPAASPPTARAEPPVRPAAPANGHAPIAPPARERPLPPPAPLRAARDPEDRATAPPAEAPPDAPAGAMPRPTDVSAVLQNWPRVVEGLRPRDPRLQAFLRSGAPVAVEGDFVVVGFDAKYEIHRKKFEEPKNRDIVESVMSEVYGYPFHLRCKAMSEAELAQTRVTGQPRSGPEPEPAESPAPVPPRVAKAQAIFNDD